MQDHEKRVVDEHKEVGDKVIALIDFMHTETFSELTAVNQGLMMVQQVAMQNYYEALSRRIELFEF
jgi:hypothetical protein